MEITEGTFFYDQWKVVNTPTYMAYWFFNVTNKDEFLNQNPAGSVRIKVQEVGPYVYR